jgi:hypothetical protein|tara:strand:+ start:166 stop:516 length:351 start_codon:yes stop_codon:yes gene_type:complete
MYKFKTKYKSSFGTTDELQYIRQGESAPQSTTDTTPQFKQSNYNFSIVAAVSSGKYIPIQTTQLTGKGVSNEAKIYNEFDESHNQFTDGYCTFGKMNKYSRHRLFKKDNVIYDLTF